MSFTYATLKTAVQDYCETAETTFVATLPTFIQEAEERILKNVELPVFRSNVTGTATADSPYLSTPTDFLSPYSLAVITSSVYTYLLLEITLLMHQQRAFLSIMPYLTILHFYWLLLPIIQAQV